MAQRRKHKVGDTFLVQGVLRNEADAPIDLLTAAVTIKSSLLSDCGREFPLEVVIKDQVVSRGGFTLIANTTTWPADEELRWDVQFTLDDVVSSTETIIITTVADVTPA